MAKCVPTEDLLEALRELGDETPPTAQECRDDGEYGPKVYQRRFGSWNAALKTAGYDADALRQQDILEEALLNDLREVGGEDAPTATEYQDAGRYDVDTYQRRFESWVGALEAAGYDANDRAWSLSKGEVVDRLHRAADDLGHAPSSYEIRHDIDYLGEGTVFRKFSSWSDALAAAGIDKDLLTECEKCGTEFGTRQGWKTHQTKMHGSGGTKASDSPSTETVYLGGWRKARQRALERDGYTCQKCGITDAEHREQRGSSLHVHHILPYHTFTNPGAAHGLWNLLTLCSRCHRRRHNVKSTDRFEELHDELSRTVDT